MSATIYYTEIKKDEQGRTWYYINGDTGYLIGCKGKRCDNLWTPIEAEKDYLSEKATIEREIEFRRANGFYD